ncbi:MULTISPECIES: S26 family signal peptidase [unclassified Mesorhizobium]|uniref:S26 family signal peptidase n=1 Tax=unclassified Mesorhizobium TaxID=325217 RepID=UPI001FE04550|nr:MULTISPECIES: S26 family signal peptidase [unclassified Mesorhizobium]
MRAAPQRAAGEVPCRAAGNHVCTSNEVIIIGGEILVRRLATDRQGFPLPWWNECRALADDAAFLLGGNATGFFDSRYFGPGAGRKYHRSARVLPMFGDDHLLPGAPALVRGG